MCIYTSVLTAGRCAYIHCTVGDQRVKYSFIHSIHSIENRLLEKCETQTRYRLQSDREYASMDVERIFMSRLCNATIG